MSKTYASESPGPQAMTVTRLRKMKQQGEKIAMLTAYDASFAAILDQAGVDLVLVGDTLGMVIQGHDTTVPVTMDHMLYHTKMVSRACQHALVIGDMPFMSFSDPARALDNAARLMQEGGARMVKLEGGGDVIEVVANLSKHGIPVCAHLGLQPQAVHKLGGYRVQGRDQQTADAILHDAKAMQDAGADIVLLECVPSELAKQITEALTVPTIGIGAGRDCDGQVLVLYDVLGISLGHRPRFAKNFLAELSTGEVSISTAIRAYVDAVKQQRFPDDEHIFH
jgi:3-methyl-2-oxobutanoate hydroxymethyltransferase